MSLQWQNLCWLMFSSAILKMIILLSLSPTRMIAVEHFLVAQIAESRHQPILIIKAKKHLCCSMLVNMNTPIQDGDSGRKLFEEPILFNLLSDYFKKFSDDTNQIKNVLGLHKWQVVIWIHHYANLFPWNLSMKSAQTILEFLV